MKDLLKEDRIIRFGWFLFTGGPQCVVSGRITKKSFTVTIDSTISFIPNYFPLPSIDDAGRVVPEPLPVSNIKFNDRRFRKWRSPFKEQLFQDEAPDSKLKSVPSARIVRYLGQKRRIGYEDIFSVRGLTAIEMENKPYTDDMPPLLTEITPLLCRISSYPTRLDDKKEIRITSSNCNALVVTQYPSYNFHLIFFSIEMGINQLEHLKVKRA